ncbi:hypothetical protein WH87_15735 [Devosia epidermidihirudinis]|uniref:Uncharacterized protein n=1 Tax=Devosia epidermidihirudinis TaxID=1293439 RepID=A0A0F5Q3P8_9HYPH|nr:hypothetical protein [Devosia epidermidihirudinis]KKC35515.1 hypothetical protein WH87_15735 [Devosia epidermidihirudinis]
MFVTTLPDRPVSAASQNEFVRPPQRNLAVERIAPPTPVEAPAKTNNESKPPVQTGGSGTTFAAAVLSGALAPTPKTLSELYARIGTSDIPEGSELRLRNLQV